MKPPKRLQSLVEESLIATEVRQLMNAKDTTIYVVCEPLLTTMLVNELNGIGFDAQWLEGVERLPSSPDDLD